MKKGSGLSSLVVFIIVAFIVIKVIIPKFIDKTGDTAGLYMSLTELGTAIEEFRQYYLKNGNFSNINIMTYVSGFENSHERLEFNKPVKYGVLDSDGVMNYCTELIVTNTESQEYIELKPIYSRTEICRLFIDDVRYQNLRKTKLAY